MTQTPESMPDSDEGVPSPVIRKARRISIIWLIPLIAAVVGGWLIVKALREEGPTITIIIDSAEGLAPGKTRIKYKDVVVGEVESIQLTDDLSKVEVVATMSPELTDYLTEDAVFWVVRARVAAGEVTGISTLLSGGYIGMEPGTHGKKTRRHFAGMEKPPAVFRDTPGKQFHLRAAQLGSIDIGSPVYYREVRVGRVTNVQMATDGTGLLIEIFVEAPYHHQVNQNARFYNVSGLNVNLNANGLQLDTPSIASLMIGGISFFKVDEAVEEGGAVPDKNLSIPEDMVFPLYANRDAAHAATYTYREYYLLFFEGNVRGLSVGAPVELHGIKIGEVVNIRLIFDKENLSFNVPILIAIEPGRFGIPDASDTSVRKIIEDLVDKGLHAEQRLGNIITGQSYVSMNFYPNAPKKKIQYTGQYPVLPTVPNVIEEISTSARRIMDKISRLPLEETLSDIRKAARHVDESLGSDTMKSAIRNIDASFAEFKKITGDFNETTLPRLNQMLEQAKNALAEAETALSKAGNMVGQGEPMMYNLNQLLLNLQDAVRAVEALADYLEQYPDAIVFGRGEEE